MWKPGFCCDLGARKEVFFRLVPLREQREIDSVIGQETNERKLKKANIYIALPSLSSISHSSLYFTGPAQCTAYSRCSVLLADIVFWFCSCIFGLSLAWTYLRALCLTLFLGEADLGQLVLGKARGTSHAGGHCCQPLSPGLHWSLCWGHTSCP